MRVVGRVLGAALALASCMAGVPGAGSAAAAPRPAAPPADQLPTLAQPSDFNGDGYADLAVGAPGDRVGRGVVHVLPGGPNGPNPALSATWTQDSPGIGGTMRRDAFGSALASADFNRDGFADLAIGAPRDVQTLAVWGAVNVLYGSSVGLVATGNQYVRAIDLPGASGRPGRFGSALVAGDFDGDGYPDLAIGEPESGSVRVLRGSASGLETPGTLLSPEPDGVSAYGRSLASGDTNGDGIDDLIVGAPSHGGSTGWAGAIYVHLGSATGPTSAGLLVEAAAAGITAAGPEFGDAVASGDFDADGFDDVAVGAPGTIGGTVAIMPGSPSGPTTSGSRIWTQDTPGVPGASERDDGFGAALAAGRLDDGTADDLVVGVPNESLGNRAYDRQGAIVVLQGRSGTGLVTDGARAITRHTGGLPGSAQRYDRFGSALAIANFAGSPTADLAVGLPGHSFAPLAQGAGGALLVVGTPSGLTMTGSRLWTQATPGIVGKPGYADGFGAVIAS